MKKIIYSLILIFVLFLTTDVYADTCSTKGVNECNSTTYTAKDGTKKNCVWYTKGRNGDSGVCSTQEEKTCEVGSRHCNCFDSNTCPAKDDFGNACHKYPTAGCVAETEYEASQTSFDDDEYNNYDEGNVTCGNGLTFNKSVVNITYYMVLLFQIIAPVMLIVLGMIDLFKGVTSGKDDEIKKAQGKFFKRLFVALLMFLVITIAKIVINVFSDANIMDCFNCFVNGSKSC